MAASLDTIFAALSDPTRRRILSMLLEDDMAVSDVADPFEMSLAAISKHLGILAAAGLITQERRGRVKWCKLEPDALREASIWMQGFGQFEAINLDAFERFLAVELAGGDALPELVLPDATAPATPPGGAAPDAGEGAERGGADEDDAPAGESGESGTGRG